MDKKVNIQLDAEAIRQIKDNPTKIVNGNNLTDNTQFTHSISKMMSQQLELAISKNDKKTLSRFARSSLVPDNMKDNFIEAINRQKGLRGILVKAVNKTNAIIQNLAQKIDKFFDKVNDKVANKKLDKYLEEYQLKEFNKAPPLKDLNLKQNINSKLLDMAGEFVSKHNLKDLSDLKTSDKLLQNEFMAQATRAGLNPVEAKTALFQTVYRNKKQELFYEQQNSLNSQQAKIKDFEKTVETLKSQLAVYEKKEAAKNETLEDFKTLTQDVHSVDKIDFLIENKEYLAMSETEKLDIENKLLYQQEPVKERAAEVKEIAQVINTEPKFETVQDRTPSINFYDKSTKLDLETKWKELQTINRASNAPNRDFMNISAVKFNGVSTEHLKKWEEYAKANTNDDKEKSHIVQFVDASIRNAKELVKSGVMVEASAGEFKFKDNFAKEALYKNVDKTVAEIQEANQGKTVKLELNPKEELRERVQSLSSDKSFDKLLDENGQVDSQKLHAYAEQLQSLATQLHIQNNAITKDDLAIANKGNTQEAKNEKAAGAER